MNTSIELTRNAYNAAFYELGLRWCWDDATWDGLSKIDDESERIRVYVEQHQPHLLKAYEIDFLTGLISGAKLRCDEVLRASPAAGAVDWAAIQATEIGS